MHDVTNNALLKKKAEIKKIINERKSRKSKKTCTQSAESMGLILAVISFSQLTAITNHTSALFSTLTSSRGITKQVVQNNLVDGSHATTISMNEHLYFFFPKNTDERWKTLQRFKSFSSNAFSWDNRLPHVIHFQLFLLTIFPNGLCNCTLFIFKKIYKTIKNCLLAFGKS